MAGRRGTASALRERMHPCVRVHRLVRAIPWKIALEIFPLNDLNAAIELWRLGKRDEARARCEALLNDPDQGSAALALLADMHMMGGQPATALPFLTRLVSRFPTDASAYRRLGDALLGLGQNAEAVDAYDHAVRLEPVNARCHNNRGLALLRLGAVPAAIASFETALAQKPDYAVAANNRALALASLEPATGGVAAPGAVQAERELSLGFQRLNEGQAAQALSHFQRALSLGPAQTQAKVGAISAYLRLGRARDALPFVEAAVADAPDHAELLTNASAVYLALRRARDALPLADKAATLRPDLYQAHFNRAEALRAKSEHDQARVAYERTLKLAPTFLPALVGLGHTHRERADAVAEMASFQRALAVDPDHVAARLGLAFAHVPVLATDDRELDLGRAAFSENLRAFEGWLATHPELEEQVTANLTTPFYLAYQERPNRGLLSQTGPFYAGLMARWAGRRSWSAVPPLPPSHTQRRVRLGIVSSHVRDHSVYRALTRGWLAHLSALRLDMTVFNVGQLQDESTLEARTRTRIEECGALSLAESVEAIRRFQPDVLLYPEVGMDLTTLQLASLRLAPAQIASWGHPETTGLPTIDYYLSAEAFEPPDAQASYTERLITLPRLGCHYEPYLDEPPADRQSDAEASAPSLESLGIRAGVPLLVSAGTPYKYAPAHDGLYVEIARALGDCQIVLFEARPQSLSAQLRARLAVRFRDAGLDPDRYLVTLPWLTRDGFFSVMRRADVYLDTPGFSGFNTVMQALECALPIVAYEGRFMRGRFAAGILRQLDLADDIATDHGGYVERVVRLASDAKRRARLREELRQRRGHLYRDRAGVDALAALIERLARDDARPPAAQGEGLGAPATPG